MSLDVGGIGIGRRRRSSRTAVITVTVAMRGELTQGHTAERQS